jgi:hypothetical protein
MLGNLLKLVSAADSSLAMYLARVTWRWGLCCWWEDDLSGVWQTCNSVLWAMPSC